MLVLKRELRELQEYILVLLIRALVIGRMDEAEWPEGRGADEPEPQKAQRKSAKIAEKGN